MAQFSVTDMSGKKVMLRKIPLTFLGTFFIFTPAYAQQDKATKFCAYNVGQVIEPKPLGYVWNNVNPESLEKGEFETSFDFNKRVEDSKKLSRFPFPIKAEVKPYQFEYDADKQVFTFKPNFSIQPSLYFNKKMREFRKENSEVSLYNHAFQIAREFKVNPINITKINKSGEAIEVENHETKYIHVFDRVKAVSYTHLTLPTKRIV